MDVQYVSVQKTFPHLWKTLPLNALNMTQEFSLVYKLFKKILKLGIYSLTRAILLSTECWKRSSYSVFTKPQSILVERSRTITLFSLDNVWKRVIHWLVNGNSRQFSCPQRTTSSTLNALPQGWSFLKRFGEANSGTRVYETNQKVNLAI